MDFRSEILEYDFCKQSVCITTSEYQKVSRVLSDWDSQSMPFVPDLSALDSATKEDTRSLCQLLFQPCLCTSYPDKKLDSRVAEVLMTVLLQHFPEVLHRYPLYPYVGRVRECLMTLGIATSRVLAWSAELQRQVTEREKTSTDAVCDVITREEKLINHQNSIIADMVALNQDLVQRVTDLERRLALCGGRCATTTAEEVSPDESAAMNAEAVCTKKSCGSKALPKSPTVFWYEWYAKTPRLWDVCTNRQDKSTYKQITNYMKLFLPKGFALDPSSAIYCDQVMSTGKDAERGVYDFFRTHGIKSRNGYSVLKQLRKLHRDGKLSELIKDYVSRVNIGGICDPTPNRVKDFFQVEM